MLILCQVEVLYSKIRVIILRILDQDSVKITKKTDPLHSFKILTIQQVISQA